MADVSGFFSEIAAGALAGMQASRKAPIAVLKLGDKILPFPMIDISEGTQGSRLQVDISLNGTQHVCGSMEGLGTYKLLFMDCPVILANYSFGDKLSFLKGAWSKTSGLKTTMANQYLSADTLKDRSITVWLYNRNNYSVNCGNVGKITGTFTDDPTIVGVFRGVAIGIHVKLDPPQMQQVDAMITTQVDAIGSWKAS